MGQLRGGDLKRAQLVPSSVFASPSEVVEADTLSLPQKLAILRRWEFDARRVAGFGERSMLRRIQSALQALGARRQEWPPLAPFDEVSEVPGLAEAPRDEGRREAGRLFKF